MFKSYTALRNQFGEISGADDTTSLARFDEQANQTQSIICAMRGGKWAFLEKTATETGVAAQQNYDLPGDCRRVISVRGRVSTTDYLPVAVESPEMWHTIEAMNLGDSNTPLFWHQRGNEILVEPNPSSTAITFQFVYRKRIKELSIADYTTGNVAAATNGSVTVTGTGTTWTALMIGRFIRIRGTNGDNQWYEVETRASNTSIGLAREYQGTTFSAATDAYTIGEMPLLPPEYHDLMMWRPLALHYAMMEDIEMSRHYWRMYDGGYEAGFSTQIKGLLGVMLEEESQGTQEGAIISSHRELLDRIMYSDPNTPPQRNTIVLET